MNELNDIDNSVALRQPNKLLRIILYGDCKFKENVSKLIFIATIQLIKNSNRFRSSHQRCSIKKVFLEISQSSQENTCARVSFLIKLQIRTSLQLY